jgi:outer membrane protein OmpA-like peptidoglycan-associated protein
MTRSSMLPTAALIVAVTLPASVRAEFSTSVMRPTPLDAATGQIAGALPGGDGSRSYYVAADLAAGDLAAQLTVAGRPGTAKSVTIELLDAQARSAESAYAMTERDGRAEVARTLPVDSSGPHVLRVVVKGPETGRFCIQLGGSALPGAKAVPCPGSEEQAVLAPPPPVAEPPRPVVAPPPPAPAEPQQGFKVLAGQKAVEVLESRCEQRLKVNADLLFDFDKAVLRPQAKPALDLVARLVADRRKPVTIEGHTDSKGSETYNQALSERRAIAVEGALLDRLPHAPPLSVRGYGELRPVAPNALPDGGDDPDGRQKNRRVELVIDTCA